jgi:hypothetical protein
MDNPDRFIALIDDPTGLGPTSFRISNLRSQPLVLCGEPDAPNQSASHFRLCLAAIIDMDMLYADMLMSAVT